MSSTSSVRTEFDAHQFPNAYPDGIEGHYWNSARNAILWRHLRPMLKPGDRVMDVGCGRGITVDYLRRKGVDAVGCDLGSPEPLHEVVAPHLYLGQDVLTLPLKLRNRCRAILLLDVLEHLERPELFVRSLADSLPSCSTLLATMPARSELWSNYDEYYGHFRRYDREAMKELFQETPFSSPKIRYFFHGLYPPARLLAGMGKPRSVTIAPPAGWKRGLHPLIRQAFILEERLVPAWIPGTSIMGIGHRPVIV